MQKRVPFRPFHLFELLAAYEAGNAPIDVAVSNYFRAHKALGSKDRLWLAETVYGMIRWEGLLDALAKEKTWEGRYEVYSSGKWRGEHPELAEHLQVSFPQFLWEVLVTEYGKEEARSICLTANESAPTTIRANTHKISRDALLEKLSDHATVYPCKESPEGITFSKRYPFTSLPLFKEGFYEGQDEGSQIVASLIEAKPGDHVLDYCAGAGGKSLAFAPQMENRGQIYLHDIRPWILQEGKKRFRRAGIQNIQLLLPDSPTHKKLKEKMDWVIADVPCSGTGTLRRNPDQKWNLTPEALTRLLGEQRTIFERALSYLKPGGKIVYATCSILAPENQQQVDHFLATYPVTLVKTWHSLPQPGGMDGFYASVLTKKS